jgi:hypothetical protein
MAVKISNDEYRQDPRTGTDSGGAQSNNRHVETEKHSPTKQETKMIGMVLKAQNDLKSNMGTVKKISNISDGIKVTTDAVNPRHKTRWRASERRETTKSRFAGAMVEVRTKVPKPVPTALCHNRLHCKWERLSNLIRISNNMHIWQVFCNYINMAFQTIASCLQATAKLRWVRSVCALC